MPLLMSLIQNQRQTFLSLTIQENYLIAYIAHLELIDSFNYTHVQAIMA